MGQYYYTVNIDKDEFLHPHRFGEGLKLMEFACDQEGSMTALAILLADGNGRGGGDLHSDSPLVGSWAGDRIVVTGDYADAGNFLTREQIEAFVNDPENEEWVKDRRDNGDDPLKCVTLMMYADWCCKDISFAIQDVMKEGAPWLKEVIEEREKQDYMGMRREREVKALAAKT